MLILFASSAFASTETAYVMVPMSPGWGNEYTDPCPQAPGAPVPANGYCREGQTCPWGYEPVTKYCFNGGFHNCGITCRNDDMYRGH